MERQAVITMLSWMKDGLVKREQIPAEVIEAFSGNDYSEKLRSAYSEALDSAIDALQQ